MGITIKGAGDLLSSLTVNLPQAASPLPQVTESGDSFKDIWNTQKAGSDPDAGVKPAEKKSDIAADNKTVKDSGNDTAKKPEDESPKAEKTEDTGKTEKQDSGKPAEKALSKDAKETDTQAEVSEGNTERILSPAEMDAALALLTSLGAQLLDQAGHLLEADPQELVQILTDMNLEVSDLTDPEVLTSFLFEATGVEDSLALLTDDVNYPIFKELGAQLEQITQMPTDIEGLNVAELQEVLTQMQETVTEQPEELTPETEILPQTQILPTAVPTDDKPVRSKANEEEDEELPTVSRTEVTEDGDRITGKVTTDQGQTLGAEALLKKGNKHGESQEQTGNGNAAADFKQAFEPQIQNAAPTTETTPYSQTQEIARQILDYIRTNVKEDFSSLEMQLHPQSLGNLQIHISNREGVVTANFVAQSEQVKSVIEAQMVQLQERFEEQGVRVEAIEVTVQTRAFDQNLNQNGSGDAQQSEAGKSKTRRLRIDGDLSDEDLEDLDDEERLAAEMMAANGNTLDYKA